MIIDYSPRESGSLAICRFIPVRRLSSWFEAGLDLVEHKEDGRH